MLAVYETIDLGLVTTLAQVSADEHGEPPLDLLHGNHPVFLLDPLHDDMVYIYHAFGVHALDIGPVLQTLTVALESEDQSLLQKSLEKTAMSNVQPILSTFSVERKFVAFLILRYSLINFFLGTRILLLQLQSQTTST